MYGGGGVVKWGARLRVGGALRLAYKTNNNTCAPCATADPTQRGAQLSLRVVSTAHNIRDNAMTMKELYGTG